MTAAERLPRIVDDVLAQRVAHHPAVMVAGPRATGKTTSAVPLAATVLRLDEPGQAAVVAADPDAALRGLPEPILIDEWQVVPSVLGAVKRSVDLNPLPGRFIITGSVRGDLVSDNWPGTGRLLRVAMYGLTMSETEHRIPAVPLLDRLAAGDLTALDAESRLDLRDYAELMLRSGFPEPVLRLPSTERAGWLDSYLEQILTRDVADLVGRRDTQRLRAYVEALAANTAGVVNGQTLQNAAGISRDTGASYDGLLYDLLLVDELPSWWSNRVKRLMKAPKRYFVDPGLGLAALRIDLAGLMADADLLGRSLDTFVVSQLRASVVGASSRPRLFHLRQEDGRREVDILIEYGGGKVFALEIKAGSAPRKDDARHLIWLRDQLGDRFLGGAVLHTGPRTFQLDEKIVAAPVSALWS